MSNLNSGLEPDANAQTQSVRGTVLPSAVMTAQPRNGGDLFARPRAPWAADASGYRRPAADPSVALGQRNPDPAKQYPHTTRIAAVSGGAEGPHPAREPV